MLFVRGPSKLVIGCLICAAMMACVVGMLLKVVTWVLYGYEERDVVLGKSGGVSMLPVTCLYSCCAKDGVVA